MAPPDPARRRRGLLLGGVGLALLFVPAVAVLFLPEGYAPVAIAVMAIGIVLLAAGYFALPKRM